MADPRSHTDSDPTSLAAPGEEPAAVKRPAAPRWVKLFGVITALLIVLVVVLLLASGGNHGPGRHSGSDDNGQAVPSDGAGHKPPPGGHAP
jgi:hypothetical protein